MGSIGNALSSSAFTGNSSFSADLQQVITRAVGIASLPIQQLTNDQANLTGQQNEVQTLVSNFKSVQNAVDSINNSVGNGAYSASVSNSSVATVTTASGVLAGTYAINISNIGSNTNTVSTNGLTTVADPSTGNIDSSTTYSLTVGGKSFAITNSGGSLNGLAQAINLSNANVQATVVNVGGSSAPDYRLSIQSRQYAPVSIQLSDGTNPLLDTVATGSYVTYQINGQPATPINSDSRALNVSPGLTVNALQTGASTVTVSQSATNLSVALASFASAYNNAVDELGKSRGQNGGALTGQSIVYSLSDNLRSLANYSGSSGNIASLSDLGLTFDSNGHLQFDSTVFNQASSASLTDVMNFVGTESGGGFLQTASNLLSGITDTTTGLLPQTTQSLGAEVLSVNNQIAADQTRVTQLQTSLTQQMAAADATISSLEQQASYFTSLFSTMTQNKSNGG